ncbi:hypothetical protein COW36_22625 [bacterium (Candidatus Blackallbacteria) CG17_big_fil_post_rev_8_21_14_2_50_48_46]|uniref:Guanylate cyclase domain-containing protein n=1 Tax=bacterium (Candidatus Blackallbacteria) CG17_big_fil_post_rev_8_21_14_2_50_48_46 TaxID=2014261 RepID=A0A2M7FXZ8_9BACT|nr:MAG: hypothetical protein COW36_22625 [bacterium (Candidatus Blackallbacteria) CG17_big_fil_post_rev_8_21_14_2_50_48_46]
MSLLMGALCQLAVLTLPPLEWLESRFYDLRIYFQTPSSPNPEILLVDLLPSEIPELIDWIQKKHLTGLKALGMDFQAKDFYEHELALDTLRSAPFPVVLSSRLKFKGQAPVSIYNPQRISGKNFSIGISDYLPDPDGVLRKQAGVFYYQSAKEKKIKAIEAFTWALFKQTQNKRVRPPASSLIHFSGPNQLYPTLEFSELKKMSAHALNNKYVLVGDSQEILPFDTPTHARIPILSLHAQTLSGWLNQTYFRIPALFNLLLPLLLALLTLGVLSFTLRWGMLVSALSTLTLFFSYATLNILFFQYFNTVFAMSSPLFAILMTAGAVTVFFNRTEGQRRAAILSTFRRHLPDNMVRELLENSEPDRLTLHERRVVTVMFTDIKGFSRMGEKLPPDQIIHILNEYLTAMTDIVFNNQGTLDKYIGDGIMAVYGNIGENNPRQNAYYAVKTALEMRIEMERLQKKWMHEGLRPIQIRIGINTGEALVGYVGHPKRKEVTVIGDTVNTAARIEKLNKKYHTHILISHSTYEYVKDWMDSVALGEEKLMGKTSSVKIYEIRGWKDEKIPS